MSANEGCNRTYRMVGVNNGHHELSHHRSDEEKVEQLKKIDLFLVSEFARFLKKLQVDSRRHRHAARQLHDHVRQRPLRRQPPRHDDLPIILAGRGGGTIKTGRHIDPDREDAAQQPLPLDARPRRRRRRRRSATAPAG